MNKILEDSIIESINNEPTIFYQPHLQNLENQRIKIPTGSKTKN